MITPSPSQILVTTWLGAEAARCLRSQSSATTRALARACQTSGRLAATPTAAVHLTRVSTTAVRWQLTATASVSSGTWPPPTPTTWTTSGATRGSAWDRCATASTTGVRPPSSPSRATLCSPPTWPMVWCSSTPWSTSTPPLPSSTPPPSPSARLATSQPPTRTPSSPSHSAATSSAPATWSAVSTSPSHLLLASKQRYGRDLQVPAGAAPWAAGAADSAAGIDPGAA
mmetsp:Transcript_4241/g.9238  ORF Transcript_4241/g.9238 Transcript_4241/m.9238 type:complete len:228 (+) Transcript_4241:648-1331(+)